MNTRPLLEGRRALITSGARGIGRAIALLLAEHGADVLVGGRNEKTLAATVAQLQAISPDSRGYVMDLSKVEETEQACESILRDVGGVDILVNTVGVNARCIAHAWQDETMARLMETNLYSGLRCARKFLPGMADRGFGSIVNISSIHSAYTMPGNLIYAATKGAMNASARAMALDYARTGIRVNNICPGLIMSDMLMDEVNAYPEWPERESFLTLLDGMQPLKPGRMEDIANAVLFFASDMSAYITGQTLFVDGGASIKAHP